MTKLLGPSASHRGAFLALGLAIAGLVACASLRGPLPDSPGAVIALWCGAGGLWACALFLAPRVRAGGAELAGLLLLALGLRGAALLSPPESSDDHHRYAWEGGLILEGKSPYACAPAAPERAPERARWPETYRDLNHPDVSAAYPPVAQLAFASAVAVAGGVERAGPSLRGLFALADLLVLIPLAVLLRARGRPWTCLVAWAWCPLAAVELGGSPHFESLGILFLFAALALAERGRDAAAGAALALGAMVKLLPAAILPFVWRDARRRARPVVSFLLPCLAAVLGVSLLEGGLGGVTSGVSEYALRWEAASLVHRFVEGGFERVLPAGGAWFEPRRLARALAGLAWLGVGALAWRRSAGPTGAAFALIGAFLVLSPTLHPWYATWIVPFLALRPVLSFVHLAALAPLLHAPVAGWVARAEWVEPAWLWPALGPPMLLLGLVELRRVRRCAA